MKKTFTNGIEWLYKPGVVYTAQYRGYNINIRRGLGKWRVFVTKNNGGSLCYKKQFHPDINEARTFGKMVVDLKEDHNETPYV